MDRHRPLPAQPSPPLSPSKSWKRERAAEWLLTGGHQNLLKPSHLGASARRLSGAAEGLYEILPVLVETRNPRILELLATYHFQLESAEAKENYLKEHAAEFRGVRDVTGMVVSGLVASGNRDKLMKLAREVGMQVPPDVLFLSEGKEPGRWRGFFYLGVGLLALIKVLMLWKKPPQPAVEG
jgi:hypothetical protein